MQICGTDYSDIWDQNCLWFYKYWSSTNRYEIARKKQNVGDVFGLLWRFAELSCLTITTRLECNKQIFDRKRKRQQHEKMLSGLGKGSNADLTGDGDLIVKISRTC